MSRLMDCISCLVDVVKANNYTSIRAKVSSDYWVIMVIRKDSLPSCRNII